MAKPLFYKSSKGNLFEYDKYANIEEPKWWPPISYGVNLPGPDSKLYLPLPLDEYPYTHLYKEDIEKKGD